MPTLAQLIAAHEARQGSVAVEWAHGAVSVREAPGGATLTGGPGGRWRPGDSTYCRADILRRSAHSTATEPRSASEGKAR
jgi:hypothetical protein